VTAELEFGVDALLHRHQTKLLQAPDLGLREVVERELGERRAAPECESRLEPVDPLRGGQRPRMGELALEAPGVDLLRRHAEHVSR
jgi:hypothetical protein